jgi:small subunit ribosomal protein S13e
MITKAAKKGQMPSQIGVLLRDQHGIPLVKSVTGSKILRILKAHGESPERALLFDLSLCARAVC